LAEDILMSISTLDGGGVKLIQFGGVKLIHPFVQ
jgi:hypothetical protein